MRSFLEQRRLVGMLLLLLGLGESGCGASRSDDPSPREEASRKHLKAIGQAVHLYCDTDRDHLSYPGNVLSTDGKPLLSWRVLLLPHLEENALYQQFKLDEAWDGPHNLPLLKRMPEVYVSPRNPGVEMGYTVYQGFSGPDALFRNGRKMSIASIVDGTSNTILAVESSNPVPWTKPEDIPFDRDKAVPNFGTAYGGRPLAVLLDGTVRILDLNTLTPTTLKSAIRPDDGGVLGPDW